MAYFAITACIILSALNTLLSKQFEKSFTFRATLFLLYNIINAAFAALFIFALNGFTLLLHPTVVWYAFAYALIVICSLFLNLLSYRFMPVPLVSLISMSGILLTSTLFSIVVLKEIPSVCLIISLILILLSAVLPFTSSKTTFRKAALPIATVLFLTAGASSICMKLFTQTTVCDHSKSLFVITNLIIFAFCAPLYVIAILYAKKKKQPIGHFTWKQTANILSRTTVSNLSSILSVIAIAAMSLPVYSVTTQALGLFSAFLLSLFYFKEKTNVKQILSVIIAIVALILSVF